MDEHFITLTPEEEATLRAWPHERSEDAGYIIERIALRARIYYRLPKTPEVLSTLTLRMLEQLSSPEVLASPRPLITSLLMPARFSVLEELTEGGSIRVPRSSQRRGKQAPSVVCITPATELPPSLMDTTRLALASASFTKAEKLWLAHALGEGELPEWTERHVRRIRTAVEKKLREVI